MKDYRIVDYTPEMMEEWDLFVEESNNGTIFHRQDFLSYHPADRFSRDDKMIFKGDRLMGLFPLGCQVTEEGKRGISPYGASYGGIVTKEISTKQSGGIVRALLDCLIEESYTEIDFIFPPDCYYKRYNGNVEYTLMKMSKGYRLADRGLTSVVDLNGDRTVSNNYKRNLTNARKAGIEVVLSDDVKVFYEILTETLVEKHGGSPTHTIEELEYLKKTLPDMVKVFLGVWEGKAVSGVLVFENSSPCVFAFYNCHLTDYAHLSSLNAVFDHIIDYYKNGKRWLDLGLTDRFSSSYNWGLFQFKEGMGATSFYRNYYTIRLS